MVPLPHHSLHSHSASGLPHVCLRASQRNAMQHCRRVSELLGKRIGIGRRHRRRHVSEVVQNRNGLKPRTGSRSRRCRRRRRSLRRARGRHPWRSETTGVAQSGHRLVPLAVGLRRLKIPQRPNGNRALEQCQLPNPLRPSRLRRVVVVRHRYAEPHRQRSDTRRRHRAVRVREASQPLEKLYVQRSRLYQR